jgi:uncharacterized lipoprotein YddW (UPF0748 family)
VQQQEFTTIADAHQKNGMNALVVQIRPVADAFYRSQYEPWSEWLSGKQGQEPNPPYDPLAFMVEESHKRGMEFHAWFNPYRATFDTISSKLSPDHVSLKHPEWLLTYGGKKIFDPGLPQVREYIVGVILDVVRNYDIDAVHFDDYFYPYPVAGDTLRDDSTFVKFPNGFANKDDWRRNNVNLLIKMIYDSIRLAKPHMKFGISPFGVWRNRSEDAQGSDTRAGNTSYAHLYADSRAWLQQGIIDYIVPQNYFSTGYRVVNYEKLTKWWLTNTNGRHLYMGQGPYKINKNADSTWFHPSEMPRQIRLNRQYPQIQGSVYFSSKSIMSNPNHIADSLQEDFYRYPSLIPTMPWRDSIAPLPPKELKAKRHLHGIILSWQAPAAAPDGDTAFYYVIYRFNRKQAINTEDPRNILAIYRDKATSFTDEKVEPGKKYIYLLTAIDRLHNESMGSKQVRIKTRRKLIKRNNT